MSLHIQIYMHQILYTKAPMYTHKHIFNVHLSMYTNSHKYIKCTHILLYAYKYTQYKNTLMYKYANKCIYTYTIYPTDKYDAHICTVCTWTHRHLICIHAGM